MIAVLGYVVQYHCFYFQDYEFPKKKKNRPSVKSAYQINKNLISQPKDVLLVLKRTVSMRRFF